MKCANCGVDIRKKQRPPFWEHIVEAPGTHRTIAAYTYCRLSVAWPGTDTDGEGKEPSSE